MNVQLALKIAVPLACAAAITSTVQAQPPYSPDLTRNGNRWEITAYDDSSTAHAQWATQGICFYPNGANGTHQRYYWISDTFPNWNGLAVQEGDQVFMHGDYATNNGHDGIQWQLTTSSKSAEGFGHWQEWRENSNLGRTIGFVNAKLRQVGECPKAETIDELTEVYERYRNIDFPKDEQGNLIMIPTGVPEERVVETTEMDALNVQ